MSDSGRVLGDGRYAGPPESTNLVCEICGMNYVNRGLLCKPASEGNAHRWKNTMPTHESRESEDDFGDNKHPPTEEKYPYDHNVIPNAIYIRCVWCGLIKGRGDDTPDPCKDHRGHYFKLPDAEVKIVEDRRKEKIEKARELIKKLEEDYKERCKVANNMYDCLMFHKVKMWRHVKTSNIYTILGISTCSTNGEQNGKQSVVYVNSEGEIFNRDTVEFLDGRFEPMNSTALKSLK